MGLADKLATTPARKPTGLPCSVGALEARLEGVEAEAFKQMMYVLGWSQERIYEAVTDEGHTIGKQTINRHRSRGCRCYQ